MPNHWTKKKDGSFSIPAKFSVLEEVEGGDVDKHIASIKDFIVSYNTAEYDDSLSFEGSEEEDEEGEEEEEEEYDE